MYKILTLLLIINLLFNLHSLASDSLQIENYKYKAEAFKYVNNDSSLHYLYKALELSERINDEMKKVDILFSLINAEIRAGNPILAVNFCNLAKDISLINGFNKEYIKSLIYLGIVHQSVGLATEAINILLNVERQISISKYYSEENLLELNFYLALVYYDIDEFKKCEDYLYRNINEAGQYKKHPKLIGTYVLFSNISTVPDSIYNYLEKANDIVNNFPQTSYEKVVILNNQALLNKTLGKLNKSKSDYMRAIKIARIQGFQSYLSNLYNNYAYQLLAENNMDSAEIVLKIALTIARQLKDIDLEASILDSYSDYFKAIGNYSLALEYKDNSIEKRNEYKKKQQIQQSLFLSTVFETEQKEKEIIEQESKINRFQSILFGAIAFIVFLLAVAICFIQKSAIRKARLHTIEREKSLEVANALIEGQDTERKRLAMDLHDGLGARLGVLRFKIDNFLGSTPYYKEIISDVDKIGKNIRELSHRMLPAQLESLGLIPSLQNLLSSINQSDVFHIELETNIEGRLTSKMETNIYYLTYELINNALKHSGGNKIFVQLLNHDDSINLSVEDNGRGFDKYKTTDGQGLKNIKQRVAYLSGEIHMDTQTNQGTLFMIEIPVNTND